MLTERRKWPVIAAVVVSLILTAVVAGCSKETPVRITEFTPEAWDAYPDLRHYMVKDMEAKIDFLNLTRDEVLDILGTNAAETFLPAEGKRGPLVYRITKIDRYIGTFNVYYIGISESGDVEETYIEQRSGVDFEGQFENTA